MGSRRLWFDALLSSVARGSMAVVRASPPSGSERSAAPAPEGSRRSAAELADVALLEFGNAPPAGPARPDVFELPLDRPAAQLS
jgi:hypothetical protein